MKGVTINDLKIGDSASLSKTVTEDLIREFAYLTSDVNPIHLDKEFAKTTTFGHRIAHGIYGAGLISAVIGTKLPGPGAIYISQVINFIKPVYFEDVITATCTVHNINLEKHLINLCTVVTNQDNEVVIKGAATIKPSKTIVTY